MKLSIVHRLSLSFVLLVTISSGVVGSLFYFKTTDLLIKHALNDIAAEVKDASKMLQAVINVHDEDVIFLSKTPPVQGILKTRINKLNDSQNVFSYEQWLSKLENIFKDHLQRKSSYLSIRYIDKQGQELVHVGYNGKNIISFRGKNLQNKLNRIYVRETLKLPQGDIYVSEINLNREFGQVVKPHQEVKRSATPIYDERNNKLAGLLVITSEIGSELHSIKEKLGQKYGDQFYITNDQGMYLIHPDASKTYSFDLGKHYQIQKDMPQLASLYLPEKMSRQTILMPDISNGQKVINFSKVSFDPAHSNRFIAVILTQDYESIVAEQVGVLNEVSIWSLLLILSGAMVGILLSIQITRPIKGMTQVVNDFAHQRPSKGKLPVEQTDEVGVLARSFKMMIKQVNKYQDDLQYLNNNLEKKVLERTRTLKLNEEHQRTILESIADAIITIDNNGLIISFNWAAEKIFNYNECEVVGHSISILLPEEKRLDHETYMKNKDVYEPEIIDHLRDLHGQRKDGEIFPIELKVMPMTWGNKKEYVGVLRDMTERKRIDRMKTEFISTVSHELRTPLTSIVGAVELIKATIPENMSEHINKLVKIIDNNSQRLLLLINDILNIQKIESEQMDFEFKCISVVSFVEQALEDNVGYAEQYGVKFRFLPAEVKLYVFADKHRLMQVMVNLLSNAAKFSNKPSVVEVSISRHKKNLVRISVTNKGSLIPDEFKQKIFEKFTQLDSSDTREKGGTGLGLSIAKSIIKKHCGDIGFVSQNGITAFYFYLPECDKPQVKKDVF